MCVHYVRVCLHMYGDTVMFTMFLGKVCPYEGVSLGIHVPCTMLLGGLLAECPHVRGCVHCVRVTVQWVSDCVCVCVCVWGGCPLCESVRDVHYVRG